MTPATRAAAIGTALAARTVTVSAARRDMATTAAVTPILMAAEMAAAVTAATEAEAVEMAAETAAAEAACDGKTMLIQGGCHCGNVKLELVWNGDPPQIPARACTCSFCVKHGGVWTSQPDARLRVRIAEAAHVHTYAFGTRTASFHVCSQCGVVPFVSCDIEGRVYAVVNVNSLDGIDPAWLSRASSNFEGEAVESRLARRRNNWIGDVDIGPAS